MDRDVDVVARLLKPLIKAVWALDVTPATSPEDLSPRASHFGGEPFLWLREETRRCSECGGLLDFVCQVWMPQDPDVLPGPAELLELYAGLGCRHSPPGWSLRLCADTRRVADEGERAAPAIHRLPGGRLYKGDRVGPCRIDLRQSRSLPDWDGAARWCRAINRESSRITAEAYENAVRSLIGDEPRSYHYLGGYPQWIQCDQTPVCRECQRSMDLLLTLGSDAVTHLNWTDLGAVYLFGCSSHRTEQELVEQFF